jgi:hypothetical protein
MECQQVRTGVVMRALAGCALCIACGDFFRFNPERVPSIRATWKQIGGKTLLIEDAKAKCRPLCQDCVHKANAIRRANGVELIPVLPGAYEPKGSHRTIAPVPLYRGGR